MNTNLESLEILYIHFPYLQFLPAQDSNLQPLDYESNSLTIRPRLPLCNQVNDIAGNSVSVLN